MRYHVRCRKCGARRVLTRHPDEYIRPPRCGTCGAKSYRIDQWKTKRNTRKQACTCGAYYFWHRIGSGYCFYRSDGSLRLPGDHDFIDRNYQE